jgi:thiamine biosynthesis lipoprotein ApbE
LLLALLLTTACNRPDAGLTHTLRLAGEPATITVPADEDRTLRVAINALHDVNNRIFPLIDIYAPYSEISRANQIASTARFPVSRDTLQALRYAHQLSTQLDGAFDITDARLRHLWERHFITNPTNTLPRELTDAARVGVGPDYLDLQNHALMLRSPETQLDLNDFIKPYLIDLAILEIRRQGYSNVRITQRDVGRTLGRADGNTPWTVPLPHPTDENATLGQMILSDGLAFAVLGAPHHYTTIGDQRVGRLIDPRSGRPPEPPLMVAVLGPVAADAYALATALLHDGLEGAPARLAASPRYHACLVQTQPVLNIFISGESAPLFELTPAAKAVTQTLPR